MDGSRFDSLVSRLTEAGSRRHVLGVLGITGLAASGLHVSLSDTEAGKRGRRKKRKGKKNSGGTPLALGAICTPGQSTCAQGLRCDSPTTRNSCSSTVDGIDAWCCVQPNGSCNECECCGNFYCGGEGTCVPNPEGQG